jgi:hypothetical protein
VIPLVGIAPAQARLERELHDVAEAAAAIAEPGRLEERLFSIGEKSSA